ncbi:MAG: glycosyltransferase family 2 protein [Candidatus Omnitrophota bacterium]
MAKISIVIPCYNEEDNIGECIRKIPEMNCESEIIVVDDGSTDRTAECARESQRPFLKVIRYEKNLGMGAALRTGLQYATGDIIVLLDADYTSPPSEIPKIIEPILDGKADFVTGTRFIYTMEQNAMKTVHRLGNKIAAFMVSLYVGQHITDSLCGLKAFKRKLLIGKLKENSWPDFELLITAKKNKMRIVELPIHYRARKAGASKMNTFKGFYRMPILLIKSFIGIN